MNTLSANELIVLLQQQISVSGDLPICVMSVNGNHADMFSKIEVSTFNLQTSEKASSTYIVIKV